MRLISDNQKAIKELKWKPKYINKKLNDAFDETISWYKNNLSINTSKSDYIV